MTISILVFSFSFLIISCDPKDSKLEIYNSTTKNIYYYHWFYYPDTAIPACNDLLEYPEDFKIKPGGTKNIGVIGSWEGMFAAHDTLMIFIFDESIFKTIPWDTIRKNYMILKRYDLSLKDLERLDWIVTYP